MSYHEELLIRIKSAYDSGGFNKLDADLSKAKQGHDQLASNSIRNSGVMKGNFNQISNAAKKSGDAIGRETNDGVNRATQGWNKLKSTASSTFNTISTGASKVASSVSQGISKGTDVAGRSFDKLKSSASSSFGTISAGAKAASSELGGLGGVIAGLAGGMGIMEVAQSMWTGSTTKQFNAAYLGTKMSSAAANDYIKQIQQIVAEVPGDDTFMNNLMTGAVAKQTNLSTSELRALGIASADYLTTSQVMGKAQLETQMDLKEYILTGNTSQLERDSILKQQMDKLEGQKTVSERILALNEALKAEGYAGLSQLDIASIKAEEIKGKFQLAATTVGEKLLPYIEDFLDFMLQLDEKTQGQSTLWMVIGGSIALLALALAPVVGATMSGYYAMKNYRIEAEKAALANAANKGPGTGTTPTSTTTTQPSPVKSTALNISSLLIVASAAAAAGGALKFMNDVLGGTHQQLMNILNLSGGAIGTSMGGLLGAMLMGEGVSIVDILQQGIPMIGIMITSFTTMKGVATGLYGALIGPFQSAYLSIVGWWAGLPAWFGGLGSRIGQLWGDVVNYFNDKGTIGGQVYDALKKIYCIIAGCSPGIIPILGVLYQTFLTVFNAIMAPVMVVRNSLQAFLTFVISQVTNLGSTVITIWNAVVATVSVWIGTGINVATGAISWAISLWNSATGTISGWISTGINVATNAIQTAINWWNQLKATIGNGINTVINIVTGSSSAGSPYEVDYLYGQGGYYESGYTPVITTTSSTTSIATATTSSTSKIVISEGAVKVEVGTIDSAERVKEVENAVIVALSELNDSKGR